MICKVKNITLNFMDANLNRKHLTCLRLRSKISTIKLSDLEKGKEKV